MFYLEFDIDGDDELEDMILSGQLKMGDYQITVLPEPVASPTDTFTLFVRGLDAITILAENVSISDIPTEPYIVSSTVLTMNIPPITLLHIGEPKLVVNDITYLTSVTPIMLISDDNPYGSGLSSTVYRIYNSTYDTGWITYMQPIYLTGLTDGTYQIDYYSTDYVNNTEPTNTATLVLDNAPPVASFTWTPSIPNVGETVIFDASTSTSNGVTIVSYQWDFGDGGHATGKIVTHAYTTIGTYTVTLNVTDSFGFWDIEQKQIQIIDNIPPTTELIIGEPKYVAETTYVTPDTPFILEANDSEGSGVYLTSYRIRNSTHNTGWLIYTSPFNLTSLANGVYTIEFNSTDIAGNVEATNSIQVTLFSWNYVFTDSYGRGTTLKINTAHKLFQFITPDEAYGIRKATYMRVYSRAITIYHKDNELRLSTLAVDTKLDFCIAYAKDIQTGKEYWLIDKVGTEN